MAVQEKVDKLFARGKFERSFFIYRNELVPLGDKYAQYMVGYMYQAGLGVTQDKVAAAAWYLLAAERGTREFIEVHERLSAELSEEQALQSMLEYGQLRLGYSDLAVLYAAIRRDVKALQRWTRSRVGRQRLPSTSFGYRENRYVSSADYYEIIHGELTARLRLLKETGGFEDLNVDTDRINLHELETRVMQKIATETEQYLQAAR